VTVRRGELAASSSGMEKAKIEAALQVNRQRVKPARPAAWNLPPVPATGGQGLACAMLKSTGRYYSGNFSRLLQFRTYQLVAGFSRFSVSDWRQSNQAVDSLLPSF